MLYRCYMYVYDVFFVYKLYDHVTSMASDCISSLYRHSVCKWDTALIVWFILADVNFYSVLCTVFAVLSAPVDLKITVPLVDNLTVIIYLFERYLLC